MDSREINEAKKLDVTIQQMISENEDVLTLSDIWYALKRSRVKLVAWLLIGALAGGLVGAGYVLLTRDQLASTVVQFSYDGIENGLDPKGAIFDVNKMKSPQIVEPVLSQLGYVNDENVNAETVRQAIVIEGQVPQDVIDRLTVVTTIATNSSSVSSLEKVLDVSYYPTQYKVSLDVGELNLSMDAGRVLLDGMLDGYREYFYDTYANVQMMGAAVSGTNYEEYDYSEAMEVLGAQISTMMSYVSGLESRGNKFRSVDKGYTFADINASLEIIRSTDLSLVDALVYSYNLTKDKELLITHLNYQIEEKRRQLGVARQTLDTINAKLGAYEKDTVLMMGNQDMQANVQTSMSLTLASTEYDALIEQSIQASTQIAQLNAQINKLQARINMAQGESTVSEIEYKRRCEEAEVKLASVAVKLDDWVSVIEQTAEEYYQTEEFKDAFKVLVPSQDGTREWVMMLVKFGLIGLVGACGVVLAVYVASTCLGMTSSDRKRRGAGASQGAAL